MSVRKLRDGVYAIDIESHGKISIECRTTPLVKSDDCVIADIVASSANEPPLRLIGVVKRQGESLSVWWIESTNLAKLLHEDSYSAVIEHGLLYSKVYADAEDLLKCIQKHSRELVGDPAYSLRRRIN
ncbi:hypothetical protein [Stieleria varia]|nr:hypothetical protein [Stieleria varia]